ncbi:hypothetical protein [Leucobacter massiliensis]|uniref:hypothetical protein n=1 Tax=Leucobacter massiliensis TaxID=1686285 RepID=UPI0011B28EE8|nr:hypothetical protein [Leucobacter massiliensis]
MDRLYEQQYGLFRTFSKKRGEEKIYQDPITGEWIREPLAKPQPVDADEYRGSYLDIQNEPNE